MATKKSKKICNKGLPIFGIILVLLGAVMLLEKYIPNFSPNIWALILIVLGISLVMKHNS